MTNTFPDFLDPSEYGLYVAYEAEQSYNEMMHNIGISELHSFEEHGIAVLEANGVPASVERGRKKDMIKNFFRGIWKKIVGLYEKVLNFIKDHIESIKKKMLDKKKDTLKKKLDDLIKSDKDGKVKFGELKYDLKKFTEIAAGSGKAWTAMKNLDNGMKNVISQLKMDDTNAVSFAKEAADDADDKFCKEMGIAKDASGEDITNAIRSYTTNGNASVVSTKFLKDNFDDIFDFALDYSKVSNKVKGALKKTEDSIDTSIKCVEDLFKKEAKETGDKGTGGKYTEYVVSGMRKAKTRLIAINNAIMNELRVAHSDCARIMTKLSTTKTATNESALVPSSFQTELASLFSF